MTFLIRGKMTLNGIFTLTGIPDNKYGPYKNNILLDVCHRKSIERQSHAIASDCMRIVTDHI